MKYSSTLAFFLTLRSSFTCFFLSYWLKYNICSVKSGYYSYSKNNWVNISIHFNKCLAEYVQICNVHVKSYSFKVTMLTSHEYTIFCIPCSWCSLFLLVVVHVVNNFSQFLFCLVLSFYLFLLIFLIVVFLLYSIITILIHLAFKLH